MSFRLYQLARLDKQRLLQEMSQLGVSAPAMPHMAEKGAIIAFKVSGLKNAAALILKQEMLSKGGEAALPRDAVLGVSHEQSVLLLATAAQYQQVCGKLRQQPFGLGELAGQLQEALQRMHTSLDPISYYNDYIRGELDFYRPLIMAIANITPDSFYDGGKYNQPEVAAEYIFDLAQQGADIIDIGAASSRPGHTPLSASEELERLLPVLELVIPHLKVPVSVDTDQPEVAEAALQAGVAIINDIGGLAPGMAQLAAAKDVPLVLMHQGGGACLPERVLDFFADGLARGRAAGIRRQQFILDPGLGFGKDIEENLLLLQRLGDFRQLGLPILIGLSNKRFVGAITGAALERRTAGNIAASCWALAQGAHIIRTHEPRQLREAAAMLAAIRDYQPREGEIYG